MKPFGNAAPVVDDNGSALLAHPRCRDENVARASIAGIAQKLNERVFYRADIMPRLAPLCLIGAQTDEATSEVCFDPEMASGCHFVDERGEFFAHSGNATLRSPRRGFRG